MENSENLSNNSSNNLNIANSGSDSALLLNSISNSQTDISDSHLNLPFTSNHYEENNAKEMKFQGDLASNGYHRLQEEVTDEKEIELTTLSKRDHEENSLSEDQSKEPLVEMSNSFFQRMKNKLSFKNEQTRTRVFGVSSLLLAPLFFCFMGAFVKFASNAGIGVFTLVFWRALIQGTFCLLILFFCYRPIKFSLLGPRGKRKYLVARGLFGTIGMTCYYFSLKVLPLSEAIILSFTTPVWTMLIAVLWLKEKWTWVDIAGIIPNLTGVVFIARPSFIFGSNANTASSPDEPEYMRLLAIGVSIFGTIIASFAYVTVRKIGNEVNTIIIVLYISSISLVCSLFFVFILESFVIPSITVFLYLFGLGFCAFIGQYALNKGFQIIPASIASTFNFIQIVFGYILGISFFHESPNIFSIIGSILIPSWLLVSIYKSLKKPKI